MLTTPRVRPAWLLIGAALLAACDDDEPPPGAFATLGSACWSDLDCASRYCCTKPTCGGGSCSYPCRTDVDCPFGSLCEGGVCYLACRGDADCYPGQRCRRDRAVCQY